MSINNRSFNLAVVKEKAYTLILEGFAIVTTLLFRIRSTIELTFTITVASLLSTTISSKTIRLVFSSLKQLKHITQTISSKTIRLSYVMKQSIKRTITMTNYMVISPLTIKLRAKAVSILSNGVTLTFTPIIAMFNYLFTFDASTLATLDTNTLADMDYTVT